MDAFEPMDPDDEDAFVDSLIEIGILEEDGFDESGEVTYVYNFALMKALMPEMYEEIMQGVNDGLMSLYEKGFVKVDYDESLTAHFSATEEGMEYFKDLGY